MGETGELFFPGSAAARCHHNPGFGASHYGLFTGIVYAFHCDACPKMSRNQAFQHFQQSCQQPHIVRFARQYSQCIDIIRRYRRNMFDCVSACDVCVRKSLACGSGISPRKRNTRRVLSPTRICIKMGSKTTVTGGPGIARFSHLRGRKPAHPCPRSCCNETVRRAACRRSAPP